MSASAEDFDINAFLVSNVTKVLGCAKGKIRLNRVVKDHILVSPL
jgi:hypothetical protein